MNNLVRNKHKLFGEMSKVQRIKSKGFELMTEFSPKKEDIKILYEKYVEEAMYQDVDPAAEFNGEVPPILDIDEYTDKLDKFEIKELLKIGPYLITLNTNKIAHVYNRYEQKLVGILNADLLWDIKTLMYNAVRKSIIVIYVKRQPEGSTSIRRKAIQCCEISIENFGHLCDSKKFKDIFTSEEILYPGYIEFDEPTSMAVTKTSEPSSLKIWSLKNYKLMYSLPPDEATYAFEVRFAKGLVILIKKVNDESVSFDVVDPSTGILLKSFSVVYNPEHSLSCIEFFDPFIIFKQEDSEVRLIDVVEDAETTCPNTQEFEPESFVFLPNYQIMAMYKDKIEIRKHSLDLMKSISVRRINYFSNNNNSACNIFIDQENNLVFNVQKKVILAREPRRPEMSRDILAPLDENTSSRVCRRIRKVASKSRERKPPKVRDAQLTYPAVLTIHDICPQDENKCNEVDCELFINSKMEDKLSIEDIKADITCIHFDNNEKSLYIATKRGHVYKFQ
ncbi:unnamed protein product [Moneuplotes crassus]|uniref:Uncharacterized protein n=1 Tax=Euplotes crassus TaxID=5936 RepID=A0AAD1UIW8_EUPCR|nr:unnamed protein product [Moneuplotes crassus]